MAGLTGIAAMAVALGIAIPPLERLGLDMSVLAIGTCLTIAALEQTRWRSPVLFRPLIVLGQRSYEVYLTHMFVVFAFFHLFLSAGKPQGLIPVLFAAVILLAGLVGALTARLYSEPLNRLLRSRWQQARRGFEAAVPVETAIEG